MKLILEIGTEAVPAPYLPPAVAALQANLEAQLREARVAVGSVTVWATPKRLTAILEEVADRQADRDLTVRGPRKDIAFDAEGKPTRPALGFAKKNNVAVDDLVTVETEKGVFVEAQVHEQGQPAPEVLPRVLQRAVMDISWPKTMKWNAGGTLFPRPIRWVLALLDDHVLPLELAGVSSGRGTRGHRLQGADPVDVAKASDYLETLETLGVVLDPRTRRSSIEADLKQAAAARGGVPVGGEDLLEEVTYLCENPTVHTGEFDPKFLEMPREIVVTAMRSHQRYFAVEQADGALAPLFLVVCDGRWEDPSTVVAGNERVLRARLADARFYWDVDLKQGLDAMAEQLNGVVWLETLGSLGDKSTRVGSLVDWLGRRLLPTWSAVEVHAQRAARLAKADLASEMIKDGKEFTGLQGVVAARYAQALGEAPEVCTALEEQYLPRGAADPLPGSPAGMVLALADRMDTIAGCFAAGLIPSGSQDPYALRRAANGIVRILMEQEHHLDLRAFVDRAVESLPAGVQSTELNDTVAAFLGERIAHFLGRHGSSHDAVDAVMATGTLDPLDALARARALEAVRGEEDLARLVVGYKRAANILKGVDVEALPALGAVDWSGAEPAETELAKAAQRVEGDVLEALKQTDYPLMLRRLLTLRGPIDTFFDEVMVMAEDPRERERRLALLAGVRGLFDHFCDLSRVVIEGS